MPVDITFEAFLTAAGAGIAGAVITGLTELLKRVFPIIEKRGWVLLLVFGESLILYLLTAVATSVSTFNAGLNVFLAWLTCAAASVGVFNVGQRVSGRDATE
jgi:predicted membrane protein